MNDSPDELESQLADSVQCGSGPDDSAARLEESAANGVKADSDQGSTELRKPPATVLDFVKALRALGFGSRQAKAIARTGFRPAMAEQEAERDSDDMQSLVAALQRRARALER